jgi:type I restriction enzyme M protein
MSKNERKTDFFIGKLLDAASIKYTPNGSDIKEIQDALKTASKKGTGNVGFPEFVALSKEFILVIENKADLDKQAAYENNDSSKLRTDSKSITGYAENGALHYAQVILQKTSFKKVFAFGCSGDEKHHCIRPLFVDKTGYALLDRLENFENFNSKNIEKYYKEQVLKEIPKEIKDKEAIIREAQTLHEHLRNYGQLGESEKPLVVSAILLALCDEKNFKIDSLVGDDIETDGEKIFRSIDNYMKKVKVTPTTKKEKVLGQFSVIKNRTLLNQVDERLGKTPLRYFAEFLEEKILESVKANHIEDVLGRFYGEFISFSGGDGQTLGVVLTPSHITDLFCDLVDIKSSDRVLDPCCGTGGFLITAMHRMIEGASADQITSIKREQLHGIEIREDMFSIATTNMILRGDGKSNLENLDFLKMSDKELRKKKCNVGFINPPYSQAKGKETSHLSEIGFVEHLLNGLDDGGKCAVIVPLSTMVGKTKEDKFIKRRILENHSLEGVITLNKNTFYSVGTNTCIAIFTAHEIHKANKRCKFINFEDDGFTVSKHIGLVKTTRAVSQKVKLLNCWRDMEDAESKFLVKTTIEPDDEWLHSFYYFNDEIPKESDFSKAIGEYLGFEFSMIMEGKGYLFEGEA